MRLIKCILSFALIVGSVNFVSVLAQEEQQNPENENIFIDVPLGHSEYVAIKYLKENGIIEGYQDGTFQPDRLISRIEALKLILLANNIITQEYITNNLIGGTDHKNNIELVTFPDIYKSMWYFPYVKKSVEENIINGFADGTFKPDNTINRAESFKIVMESDNLELIEPSENPFNDVNSDAWFAKYFLEAKNRQIIYVSMSNNVYPQKEMTRSMFAELIYRYIKSKEGCRYGGGSYYSDWFEGRGTASGEPYLASELTAAHLTLPFNTMVKVTNLENGKSIEVRINDRGPYITGRVIDLSKSAFEQIGYTGQGVIWVEYQTITQQ
ncbi:septal ring lytic transglycosylase RlpA family protein [Candidatus Peregrinibacteria bacterium]|nr:septal ring lytic transglycosylase RlpA family protein [Candidatus Peregrinibacteria bacterium]